MIRLAELAAFPLLLALPQRIAGSETVSEGTSPAVKQKTPGGQKETDPKLLQTYLSLATETDPVRVYQGVSRAYAQLMVADMCLLALPPDASNQILVPVGYDLIMDRVIEGFSVAAQNMPLLANVLRRGRNLRLPASSNSIDLVSLAKSLGVEQAGHLLSVAVSPKAGPPLLSIVLLSPYSKRVWSAQDQQRLIDTAAPMASILQRVQYDAQLLQELEKARAQTEAAQSSADLAQQDKTATAAQVEHLQSELEQEQARTVNLAALVAGLEARVISQEAKPSRSRASEEAAQTQGELNLALAEIARLRAEVADQSQLRLRQPGETSSDEKLKTLAVIAQEFRRPVDSISGQCDLLLSESVGLLGARQRKTLERLKAASERIHGLVGEMVDITTLDNGAKVLTPTIVDLNTVIDEALAGLIPNLSARNIALRVDLPDVLPELYADRQAVLQVLATLLNTAGEITPTDGDICLRARVEEKDNERGYILLQVTHSGEGIPAEELPGIFSRQVLADDQAPQSGEAESGLAKAKSLVEAHGGRVWVDSEAGQGATYSVLLPLPERDSHQGLGGGFEV
jgi:signal transduction histidine kinase